MKAKNKWTYADCDRIIRENKDKTAYFDKELKFEKMWEMFRYDMHFGEAETAVILASLIKAGAWFK